MSHPERLLLYCRPGFESDCAAEITARAAAVGVVGFCRARPQTGYLVFTAAAPFDGEALYEALPWRSLVFARQRLLLAAELTDLPAADRATPLAAAAPRRRIGTLWLEYPDTNEGKALSRLCRRFARPLEAALRRHGVTICDDPDATRLHVCFVASGHAFLALSEPGDSAPWPLGIPRLRLPRAAPSRSALKLDEAFQSFLTPDQRARRLRPGMTAVDLGAAPGGWSWQLARHGLHVIAVDNGAMERDLLAGGLVEHVRADGFRFRPARAVDWLVCDIVEQPHRIARLMGDWLVRGDCRAAVFNLKLPMKRRYQAVDAALATLSKRLRATGGDFRLACKQLYHDREEVTVMVTGS